jgi:hypothetical protein
VAQKDSLLRQDACVRDSNENPAGLVAVRNVRLLDPDPGPNHVTLSNPMESNPSSEIA